MEMIKLKKILYQPKEAAALLSDSVSKIYELVGCGELQAHCRNGRQVKPLRITADSIKAYYEKYLVDPDEYRK